MTFDVRLASSAIRDLDRIPPRIVPAIIEFLYGPLASNPQRLGKPLLEELAGNWSARRGDYRILYWIDEVENTVIVVRVGHRATVYRPH